MPKSHTVANVLRSISDNLSLDLYRTIAKSNGESGDSLLAKIKITRKQFYSRLSSLTNAGLIKRKQGKYSLTTFGKVVYNSEKAIENAYNIYWKLRAIDSIGISSDLPEEEYSKIVDALIDNYQIKDTLMKNEDFKDKKTDTNKAKLTTKFPETARIERIS
jgi:DNA-binding HxlR family transcriptional regulator